MKTIKTALSACVLLDRSPRARALRGALDVFRSEEARLRRVLAARRRAPPPPHPLARQLRPAEIGVNRQLLAKEISALDVKHRFSIFHVHGALTSRDVKCYNSRVHVP